MKPQQMIGSMKVNRELARNIADSLAEEMAKKMYYKLAMLKYLSEIKDIEGGKSKALKNKELDNFFTHLIRVK